MSQIFGRSRFSAAQHTVLPALLPLDAGLRSEISIAADGGQETLQEFSARLQNLIRLTGVAIALEQPGEHDGQPAPVVCVASSGPAAPPRGTVLDRSRGLSAECLRSRDTRVSNDTLSDPRVNREACRRNGILSTVVVPLLLDGKPVGVLGVFSDRTDYFTDRQVFLLEFIASFISRSAAIAPNRPEPAPIIESAALYEAGVLPETALAEEQQSPELTLAMVSDARSSRRLLLSIAAALIVVAGLASVFFSRSGQSTTDSTAAITASETGKAGAASSEAAPKGQVLGAGTDVAGSIEHWSAPGYSRITIRMDGGSSVNCERLSNPERLYCDFKGLKFPSSYAGEDFPRDPLVAGLRVGKYRPGTARVVFDLKSPAVRHAVAVLSNPPRLMVEVIDLSKMGIQESSTTRGTFTPPDESSSSTSETSSSVERMASGAAGRFTIVIDPGHGGRDTGTVGPAGLKEKDLVLDVARRLSTLLRSRLGANVILTRTMDRFLSLEKRSEIANQAGANLFLSIHGNGSDYAPAEGIETYYLGESSSAKDAHMADAENNAASASAPHLQLAAHTTPVKAGEIFDRINESRQLAEDVQRSLYKAAADEGGSRNRGIRTAPFVVLRDAAMPAILAEISFVSSRAEERKLMQASHRQALADGLFQGIALHLTRTSTVAGGARGAVQQVSAR